MAMEQTRTSLVGAGGQLGGWEGPGKVRPRDEMGRFRTDGGIRSGDGRGRLGRDRVHVSHVVDADPAQRVVGAHAQLVKEALCHPLGLVDVDLEEVGHGDVVGR